MSEWTAAPEQVIELAEWREWRFDADPPNTKHWIKPDGKSLPERMVQHDVPYRPHTDANDTDDLIRFLRERGQVVKVFHYRNEREVRVGDERWFGDDYKTGVCALAWKILEAEK